MAQSDPARSVILFGPSRGSGLRLLLFTLECALGVVAVILVAAALAHWSPRLLPVAALLYLLIVVPTALLCGFWQAVVVSLTAVFLQSYYTARPAQMHPELNQAADPTSWATLVAFVLVALYMPIFSLASSL